MTMTRDPNEAALVTCPNCGMPRDEWADDDPGGYKAEDGTVHCCKGCAEGTGCTCKASRGGTVEKAPTQDEIRQDAASGNFVQSLQKERKTVTAADYGTDATTGDTHASGGLA